MMSHTPVPPTLYPPPCAPDAKRRHSDLRCTDEPVGRLVPPTLCPRRHDVMSRHRHAPHDSVPTRCLECARMRLGAYHLRPFTVRCPKAHSLLPQRLPRAYANGGDLDLSDGPASPAAHFSSEASFIPFLPANIDALIALGVLAARFNPAAFRLHVRRPPLRPIWSLVSERCAYEPPGDRCSFPTGSCSSCLRRCGRVCATAPTRSFRRSDLAPWPSPAMA